jgi:hypothetical protein
MLDVGQRGLQRQRLNVAAVGNALGEGGVGGELKPPSLKAALACVPFVSARLGSFLLKSLGR